MTHYNLSSVENATGLDTFMAGVNTVTGGAYLALFWALIWIIIVLSMEDEVPVRVIVASFATSVLSGFAVLAGVSGPRPLFISVAVMFLGILWQIMSD